MHPYRKWRFYTYINIPELRGRLGVAAIVDVMRICRLRWHGHVETKDDADYVEAGTRWRRMLLSAGRGRPGMRMMKADSADIHERKKWRGSNVWNTALKWRRSLCMLQYLSFECDGDTMVIIELHLLKSPVLLQRPVHTDRRVAHGLSNRNLWVDEEVESVKRETNADPQGLDVAFLQTLK